VQSSKSITTKPYLRNPTTGGKKKSPQGGKKKVNGGGEKRNVPREQVSPKRKKKKNLSSIRVHPPIRGPGHSGGKGDPERGPRDEGEFLANEQNPKENLE